jgi:hypothetical protein
MQSKISPRCHARNLVDEEDAIVIARLESVGWSPGVTSGVFEAASDVGDLFAVVWTTVVQRQSELDVG